MLQHAAAVTLDGDENEIEKGFPSAQATVYATVLFMEVKTCFG